LLLDMRTKFLPVILLASHGLAADLVKVKSGMLEGGVGTDPSIRRFAGVPFAAPPVGPLRWMPLQPVTPWQGVRNAGRFGSHCMQSQVFANIIFRGNP
jgi:para-nitrobenzyl esterase